MAGAALRSLAHHAFNGAMLTVGDDGYAAASTDGFGATWEELFTGFSDDFVGIATDSLVLLPNWLAVDGNASATARLTTDYGVTWSNVTLPSSAAAQRCDYLADNTLVSNAWYWVILRGTGLCWTTTASPSTGWVNATGPGANTLRGAVVADGYLYVCGDAGLLARTQSVGGTASPTWETLTSGTVDDLFAIAVDPNGLLVAVGESGRIVYSEDGTTWLVATNSDVDSLFGVAHDGVNRWTANGATLESIESYRGLFNHGTMVIETQWIKVGEPSKVGQARVWAITLLAKRLGPHGMQVEVGYDYDESYADIYTYTGAEIEALIADGEDYELRVMPGQQKCSAIRVRFTELTPAELTYGVQLVSLTLDVGVRPGGAARVPQGKVR